MNINTKILPGIGLGGVKFGLSREEVKTLLGKPDEIERTSFPDDEDGQTETWHYDELDLSAEFEQEEDWSLTSLAITSGNYDLESKRLIGLREKALISILKELGADDLEFEKLASSENTSNKLISSDSLGMNFWLDNDELTEIQWSVLFYDEDIIDWPE